MAHVIFLFLLFCLCGCQGRSDDLESAEVDVAIIDGWSLEIESGTQFCRARLKQGAKAREFRLRMRPPCRLPRTAHGVPLVHGLSEPPGLQVVVILGTPISADPLDPLLAQSRACTSQAQALLLGFGEVRLSSRLADGLVLCDGMELDEKEYALFAREPQE